LKAFRPNCLLMSASRKNMTTAKTGEEKLSAG